MTDIVERLRGNLDDGIKRHPSAIKLEAADQIERLRAALKAIECHSIDHTDACRMAGKARGALEPEPESLGVDDLGQEWKRWPKP